MFIQVDKLNKFFSETPVLKNVSFGLEKGQIISIVGPSGCGKTTFLRCIAGLSFSTTGSIFVDDIDITNVKTENRPVVLMFQQPLLFPHLTTLENVTYGLKYGKAKVSKKDRIEQGLSMLEKVELVPFANRYPNQLSGGQQQRVALARALILNPKLLLLDEPFSSLDPSLRTTIRLWVRDFLKKEGVTALFVTHDREEAMMMGDQVAVMNEGSFQQIDTPDKVYQKPGNSTVAEMFAEGLNVNDQYLAADQLSLAPPRNLTEEVMETLDAVIEHKILKYGYSFYQVQVPALKQRVVVQSKLSFEDGERVILYYKKSNLLSFPQKDSQKENQAITE
ncbi:ABC transporter ATP-binding protein [Salipaludibacillus sp. HK11]|uniref:ABC transporter ATP-binding protein n=1 Tax=Salipaludibacillus sp. HK11 TaxID=3394320 RepID=UPI0039FCCA92